MFAAAAANNRGIAHGKAFLPQQTLYPLALQRTATMNHIYRLVWNHLTHAWVC
ncbi:MAG: hypothetical protein FD135_5059, partial [Comamonadaceae bacterium]